MKGRTKCEAERNKKDRGKTQEEERGTEERSGALQKGGETGGDRCRRSVLERVCV